MYLKMGRQESACPQPTQYVSQVIIVHCIGHLKPFLSQKAVQENLHDVPAGIKMAVLRQELLSIFLMTVQKVREKNRQLFCAVSI